MCNLSFVFFLYKPVNLISFMSSTITFCPQEICTRICVHIYIYIYNRGQGRRNVVGLSNLEHDQYVHATNIQKKNFFFLFLDLFLS